MKSYTALALLTISLYATAYATEDLASSETLDSDLSQYTAADSEVTDTEIKSYRSIPKSPDATKRFLAMEHDLGKILIMTKLGYKGATDAAEKAYFKKKLDILRKEWKKARFVRYKWYVFSVTN